MELLERLHGRTVAVLPDAGLRTPEKVIFTFFGYLCLLSLFRQLTPARHLFFLLLPVLLYCLCWLESTNSRPWSRILREWLSLGMILVAYWSLAWFPGRPLEHWQASWIAYDRELLNSGLRQLLEGAGGLPAAVLETLYLLLYSVPPMALGALYCCGARQRTRVFLTVLFVGTFFAYALLPLFPVMSPRFAFPGADSPHYESWARWINTWLLDHYDIGTSVFPSGHVAVAFSSAFGLLLAVPQKRFLWVPAFCFAALIYVATIYGRYHYALDGLASIAITTAAYLAFRWNSQLPESSSR